MLSLRKSVNDRQEDRKTTWKHIKFGEKADAPAEKALIQWLKNLPLSGNFRDLQRIALYYHNFLHFDPELKKLLGFKTAFDYTKAEFEKLQSQPVKESYFNAEKSIIEMTREFKADLAEWAIAYFDSAQKAAANFEEKGDKTTMETLYRWKGK